MQVNPRVRALNCRAFPCLPQEGVAPAGAAAGAATPGPICQQALKSGTGNYLANLVLFPGGWAHRQEQRAVHLLGRLLPMPLRAWRRGCQTARRRLSATASLGLLSLTRCAVPD